MRTALLAEPCSASQVDTAGPCAPSPGRWEKVLPKLEGDARWQLVATLKERRALFEDFCRNIAAEEKKLKEKRAAAAREGGCRG